MKPNLKRRSSVARSIRRSQSNAGQSGFTFEQQLLASTSANDRITAEEKLAKVIALSLSATIKTLQQENEQIEVGTKENVDDPRANLIDKLVGGSGVKPLMSETEISSIISKINQYKNSSAAKKDGTVTQKNTAILSSRLRTLKQYQDSLNKEINSWDELLQQRKNKYNFARLEKQMVSKGEKKITNSHRAQLPRPEEAWLRGLSDGRGEMDRLKEQEVMMKLCEESLHQKMARKKKGLDDKNIELEQVANKISKCAYKKFGDTDLNPNERACHSGLNMKETNTCQSTSDFAKDVQAWFQEMQSI